MADKFLTFFRGRAKHVAEQVSDRLEHDKRAGLDPGRDPDHSALVDSAALPNAFVKAPDDTTRLHRHVAEARARGILSDVDLGSWDVLVEPTAEELAAVYADGITQALPLIGFTTGDETTNQARANVGLPAIAGGDELPAIVNQVNERSVEWARSRSAELVTQISDNTREMLRSTVADAVEEGWSAAELADAIAESAAFSKVRSEAISRTELVAANNAGNLEAYKAGGPGILKEWQTANDELVEEICEENEAEGPIPLDDLFPSGDDAPPSHTNCRCALVPSFEEADAEA